MKWPTASIGDVCEVVSGSTPKTGNPAFWDGDIPWVTPKDLSELGQKYLNDTPRKITDAGLRSCSAKMLPAQSVLFSSRAPIGLVAINSIPVCTNQGFKSMVPRNGQIYPDFLYWWLKVHKQAIEQLGRGATFKEVSKRIVEEIQIPLPPLTEQKRIAGILDAADALRAKRRAALAELDALLQSTFLDMFGDPVTNPMGWEVSMIGDHTSKVGSGATPRGGAESYKSEGIALIRSMNVRDGEFQWKELARIDDSQAQKLSNVEIEVDDVLLNITGASVARVCRAPKEVLPARVNQHVCIIRPTQDLDAKYLEKALLTDSTKRRLLRIGESGATRQAITKAEVLEFDIPLPPLQLQRRFAAIVESIERQKERMHAHLAELDTLFASLQSRAFNGEL
ncbi:restriction endonuclease [bacterium]|nr:restriction endonuclease [bacterium]